MKFRIAAMAWRYSVGEHERYRNQLPGRSDELEQKETQKAIVWALQMAIVSPCCGWETRKEQLKRTITIDDYQSQLDFFSSWWKVRWRELRSDGHCSV